MPDVSGEKGFDQESYEDEEFEKNDDEPIPAIEHEGTGLNNDLDPLETPLDINPGTQVPVSIQTPNSIIRIDEPTEGTLQPHLDETPISVPTPDINNT